jgi:sterol desaturase/sphingolipid hydroxylase (fatty acid hydroxylase superfamily)
VARKTSKRKKTSKSQSAENTYVQKKKTRPALPNALYVLIFGFCCYGLIILIQKTYLAIEGFRSENQDDLINNLISVSQYILISMAPALAIAGLFTLVEILTTKRIRNATSYTISFLNLIISFAGLVIFVYLFEQALAAMGQTPLLEISAATHGYAVIYAITLAYFFVEDVLLYWVHRFEHTNRTLWYLHKIHHAVEDMDSVSGAFHPVSNIIRWLITILPLSLIIKIEFNDALLIASFIVGVHYAQHTRAPLHFGWFGKVIGDNRFHFLHHSKDPRYYNKNFAAIFPVIDMIFGTYVDPKEDPLPETGLSHLRGAQSVAEFLTGQLSPRQ